MRRGGATTASVLACLGLTLAGCSTEVRGRRRPLVSAQPLHGEIELVSEQHRDDEGSAGTTQRYDTRVFKEILRARTQGDVYDGDLLSYRATVGGGLTQYAFERDAQREHGQGTLSEYRLAGDVLRRKRYPMTFQLEKTDDLIPRQFASSLRSQRQGATGSVSWRDPNWPMRLQVSRHRTEQSDQSLSGRDRFTIQDERIDYALDHDFSSRSQLRVNAQNNRIEQARGGQPLNRREGIYTANHGWAFGPEGRHRLDSFIDYLDQSGDTQLDRLLWQERLRWRHSPTLRSSLGLIHHRSERATSDNEETRGEAQVQHHLYESLVTTGRGHLAQARFSGGSDLRRAGAGLALDYTKTNPWGRLLARADLDVQDLDQSGGQATVSVIDERHAFTVTGSLRIELNRTNIEAASVAVLSGDRLQVYQDYTLQQTNGVTEILITPGGDIVTDGDQTLSIDYRFLTEPERRERAWVSGLRLRQRFDGGLSAYYRYRNRRQRLESRDTTVVPDEFAVHLFGLEFGRQGLRLLAEHRLEASTRIPSEGTRVEGSYLWRLPADTHLSCYASQRWTDYDARPVYSVALLTLGTEVLSRLGERWALRGRVDYRDEDDSRQGQTRGFQVDAGGTYRYRQMELRLGSEYNTLDRFGTLRQGWFQYLRIKRTF